MSENAGKPFSERTHHKMVYPDQKIHELVSEITRLRAENEQLVARDRETVAQCESMEVTIERLRAELAASAEVLARLTGLINTPTTANWVSGVQFEAAHQQERWGSDHDSGKTPFDWFWLIGYLAQKAASSAIAGDAEKAMHHTISTGAALLNWHRAISGEMTAMRPGIEPPDRVGEASGATQHGEGE